MPFYSYNDGYETKANPAGTLIRIGDVFREDFILWVKLESLFSVLFLIAKDDSDWTRC